MGIPLATAVRGILFAHQHLGELWTIVRRCCHLRACGCVAKARVQSATPALDVGKAPRHCANFLAPGLHRVKVCVCAHGRHGAGVIDDEPGDRHIRCTWMLQPQSVRTTPNVP